MKTKLGITDLLSREKTDEMNEEYGKKANFENNKIGDLLDYVNGRNDSIKFI